MDVCRLGRTGRTKLRLQTQSDLNRGAGFRSAPTAQSTTRRDFRPFTRVIQLLDSERRT